MRTLPFIIAIGLWASPALADCIDPHACICPPILVDGPSAVWEGIVTSAVPVSGPFAEIEIRITQVTLRDGGTDLQSPFIGQTRKLPGSYQNIAVGSTVLVAIDEVDAISMPVVPVDSANRVGCEYAAGFSITEDDAISAMLSTECGRKLNDSGFVPPECNDTLTGCSCSTSGSASPEAALLLLALRLRRRGR